MRTTAILILCCLLHRTWGRASDSCSKGKVLPINVNQMNGLWNMKVLASRATLTNLRILHYSYAKISLTEKEGTITEFFTPMEGIYGGPISFQRVYDEETLTYRKSDEEDPEFFTFFQLHPDVLIVNRQSNRIIKTSAVYVRSSSYPESELKDFKKWTKCKEFTYFNEFNNTFDYAQKCYGLLEENTPLHLEETQNNFTSWHLVAKTSSSMDQHYNVRIPYTARLEISRKDGEHTLKEIITAPNNITIFELKFGEPAEDGNITLTFKTEDDLLLLGVKTKTGRTLYLASRTPTVRQSVIEKFRAQTLCFDTEYYYFIPGSIKVDDGEACAHHLEKWEPINFRESLGEWILTVSANTDIYQNQVYFSYGTTEIAVVDDTVHLSHTSISEGTVYTLENIHVQESTGHIIYKDAPETRAAIHSVSPYCIVFSPEGQQRLFLNCRRIRFPYNRDIVKFVKYATCRNFHQILIHQSASYVCSEMPAEVHTLDVEKIVDTWKLAAIATAAPNISDVTFPNEIQFTQNNGEVTVIDGNWTSTAKKIGNNRLQYAKGHEDAMEIRFYETLGDSLLTWFGNHRKQEIFLILFSKSGHIKPEELTKFQNFAGCFSIPVVFPKQ